MKLVKRIVPIAAVVTLFGLFLFFLSTYFFSQIQTTTDKLVISRKIAEGAFNLNYLTYEYLVRPSERIKFQWEIAYAKLGASLNELKQQGLEPYPKKITEKISTESDSLRHYFLSTLPLLTKGDFEFFDSKREKNVEAIFTDLQQIVFLAFNLENIFREEFLSAQKKAGGWFFSLVILFWAVIVWFIWCLLKEIGIRSRSQEELARANEKLTLVNKLVEFTGDGVYRYDYDEGKILYANQGFVNIMELNRRPKELTGMRLEDTFSYLEKPGMIRSLIEEKGQIRNYPYRFKTLTGKLKWVLHNSFLVEDESGKKILEAIITDITEKRNVEQRNSFLAGILDSIPLSVIATDASRRIIYVNPATEFLYGYKQDELIGKDPLILNAETNSSEIEDEIIQVLGKNQIYTKKLTNKDKKGRLFQVETSIYQLKDKQGNFIALVGFQKDITFEIKAEQEIKESELKFKTIFKQAGSAIFVADSENGKIVDCNQKAQELMGMERREIIGIKQEMLHPEKEKEKYKKIFLEHSQKGLDSFQGEIRDKQGRIKPVWISARLFNVKGKNLLVGFFADLSPRIELEKKEREVIKASVRASTEQAKAQELKKAYDQLKEMQDKLIQTEKLAALGKLSGIMAHDLRNPLAVIRNSAYILKKELSASGNSKIIKYLDLLDEEIRVADSIIEEALSFTRVKNIKAVGFDFNQTLNRVLEKLRITDSIKVKKDLADDIPEIKGDKEQIQRLFTNIIRNSLEAMESGGQLNVKTRFNDDVVLAEISDTGIGICQEDAEKVFEPMYSTKIQGTGLGLAACKNIVEAHGGHISLKSFPGKGTTVFLFLPRDPKKKAKLNKYLQVIE